MSHELRTPLNAIIGFSEMLTKEGSMMIDAKRRHDYAHLINDSGHHLLSVVNGILDMSKIESGNFEITPEPFAPRQVIEECCALLGYKAREVGIDLVVELPDSLPDMVADKRSLHQIMLNLVSNAIKFTKRGGKITVERAIRCGHHDRGRAKIPASESEPRICRASAIRSSRRVPPTTATTTARASACRSSRACWACTAATSQIVSKLGEGTRVTIRLPLDCEAARKRDEIASIAAAGTATGQFVRQSREDQCVAKVAWIAAPPSLLNGPAYWKRSAGVLATLWRSSSRYPPRS